MDRRLLCPAPGPKGSQWVQAPKWAQQPLGPKPRHFLPRLLLSGHIPLLISTSSFFSIIDTDVNVTVPRTSPNHSPNRNHHLKSLHTANRQTFQLLCLALNCYPASSLLIPQPGLFVQNRTFIILSHHLVSFYSSRATPHSPQS